MFYLTPLAALGSAASTPDAVGASYDILLDVHQAEAFVVGTLIMLAAVKVHNICISFRRPYLLLLTRTGRRVAILHVDVQRTAVATDAPEVASIYAKQQHAGRRDNTCRSHSGFHILVSLRLALRNKSFWEIRKYILL